MNAFKQGLNTKPAFPQGFPTGRTITTASQIAAHLGDSFPKRLGGHRGGRLTGLRSHHGKDIRIQNLRGRLLWFSTGKISQLQQAHCQRRQEAEQTLQPINTLHLALFEMASRFQTLVIVFHDPAVFIPMHALAGLLQGGGGNRGQQNPVQPLLSGWSVLFPDANRPQRARLFAAAGLKARRQDGQLPKGELPHRRACGPSMTGWDLQRAMGDHRPASYFIEQMGLGILLRLEAPVLETSDQKMGVGRLACLKERKHIGSPISHMDDQPLCWKAPHALDQPHPDVRFPCVALSSFASRLACRGWGAHTWFLDRAPQYLARFRHERQHRLQGQPTSSPIADCSHPARLRMMRAVYFGGVL
jgi:hypothetical protein